MATKAAANVAAIIKANNKALGAALAAGDATAISKMYAKGAKLLPPNAGVIKGKDIKAFWDTTVAAGVNGVKLKSQEVELHGSTAIEVGSYTMSAGGAVIDEGKYIVVWKKEGRDWKLSRDIFNTSRPAA